MFLFNNLFVFTEWLASAPSFCYLLAKCNFALPDAVYSPVNIDSVDASIIFFFMIISSFE